VSSISLYLVAPDPSSETQIRRLIAGAYNGQRPGGGRLSGASYSEVGRPVSGRADLTKAQILVLLLPETVIRQRLQAQLYVASGDWANFVEIIGKLPRELSRGSEYENNLGTSFLALSEKDPTYLLKALDAFERASSLEPQSLEPRFNLVVTYRKLRLDGLAEEALKS